MRVEIMPFVAWSPLKYTNLVIHLLYRYEEHLDSRLRIQTSVLWKTDSAVPCHSKYHACSPTRPCVRGVVAGVVVNISNRIVPVSLALAPASIGINDQSHND